MTYQNDPQIKVYRSIFVQISTAPIFAKLKLKALRICGCLCRIFYGNKRRNWLSVGLNKSMVRYQPRKSALTLNLPHVTICLLGKFKGETGVDHYLIKAIVVRLERPGYLVPLQRRKYKAPISKIVKLLQLIVYM